MTRPTTSRPGRPRADEREARRRAVLDAAFAELVDHGYEGVTMQGIARRAGASKETLYTWFGSRDGLFAALVEANAASSTERVRAALEGDADPRETLTAFATGLLTLLTGARSVALNRAAMTSPGLAALLLDRGRHTVGPLVERYLAATDERGELVVPDPAAAFRLLYGLVVSDTQIRVLLGEPPPDADAIATQAATAVDRFLRLLARP